MLTHLEFEQIKRAIDRLRSEDKGSGYGSVPHVRREDVIEILMPYVDGFPAPNPHPTPPQPPAPPAVPA
jgi:hypothetical protein